jgi:hypothetical protein
MERPVFPGFPAEGRVKKSKIMSKREARIEEAKLNPGVPAWRGKRRRELRVTGRGGRHGRTMNFFGSAARRLAWEDYQKVSVAMICRGARSTPYTFYKRFPSRPAFEYALVLVTFRDRTGAFNQAMEPKAWKDATPQAIVYRLVDEVIASTMTVPTLGVTQLAIRIAMSKPKGAKPYFEYRAAIIDRAVELLIRKLKIQNPKETVRNSIQMLLAIATDQAWRHGIPFKTEQKQELTETYSKLIFRCLELPSQRNTKNVGANHSEKTNFPEHFQINYGITKQSLVKYEKAVNSSGKPEFDSDKGRGVDVRDAVIWLTKAENLKTEKPMKWTRKRKSEML